MATNRHRGRTSVVEDTTVQNTDPEQDGHVQETKDEHAMVSGSQLV